MIGTLNLRHPLRIAPESARTLDQPSAANPPASQASAPWWSGQSGGRSQNGVDRPVADRGVSDVIWPTGRVAGGGHGSADAHQRFRRAGDRGLIAAPWTPLASLCFPLRETKKKADSVPPIDQVDSRCKVELKTRNP